MRAKLWAAVTAAVALVGGLAIGGATAGDKEAQSSPPASAPDRQPMQSAPRQQVHYMFQEAEADSADRSPSRTRTIADEKNGDPLPRYDLRYRFICDPEGDWLIERDWVRPIPGGKPKIHIHGFLLANDR